MRQINLKYGREVIMEHMGMTDNQYKDFVEGIKED